MKKFLFVLILIILISATLVGSSAFCFAEKSDPIANFESALQNMKEIYEQSPENILSVSFYGALNKCETILSENEDSNIIPDELVAEFKLYRFYFYREKALQNLDATFVSATFTVKFENKSFFFYDEQWLDVEQVYNEFLNKIQSSELDTDFDLIFTEYYTAIDNLVDREELDSLIAEYITSSLRLVDIAVVEKVNTVLSSKNMSVISKDEIPNFISGSDTTYYDNWFSELLSFGYSTQNALKVDRIHSKAISDLTSLPINAEEGSYREISDFAISEIQKIETEMNVQNPYLLESRKQSALMQIQFFLASEEYQNAEKDAQKKIKKISDEAVLKIQNASTIAEVDIILNETLNALADVNVGGKEWIKILVVGIVLFVVLVVAFVFFIIKKKKSIGKKRIEDDENEGEFETITFEDNSTESDAETSLNDENTKESITENTGDNKNG